MRPLEPGKGFSRTTLIYGGQGQVRKDRTKGRKQNEDGPRKTALLSFLYLRVILPLESVFFLSNLYLFKVLENSMNICLCKCAARVGIDILPIS